MKKFILLLVLAVVLFVVFFFYLKSSALEHPLGIVQLTILVLLGANAALAFWRTLISAPRAWKEIVFCQRRRQLRRKIKAKGEKERKLGTTTVVLD